MLSKIKISNYALIDELEISFSAGMGVVTGETGAGKSIILGALGLTLGERVDTAVLRNTEKKCVIETTFLIKNYGLESFFKAHDLDFETETILRREITNSGKSRAFINDTPVSLAVLKELSEFLIDVHSQHQTLVLGKSLFQLTVLDALAKNDSLLVEYKMHYAGYKTIDKEIKKVQEENQKLKADLDYFQFQFDELATANLDGLDEEELEDELNTLNSSEDIKRSLKTSINLLDDEKGVLSQLSDIEHALSTVSNKNKKVEMLLGRVGSIKIELKDVLSEQEDIEEHIVYDEERINELSEQYQLLTVLYKKHNVTNVAQLQEVSSTIEEKILNVTSFEEKLNELMQQRTGALKQLNDVSVKLSKSRKAVMPTLEQEIKTLLGGLSMPDASFKIEHTVLTDYTNKGQDEVNFLFSANKGIEHKQIGKVASGGELSRLMLCIKKVLANSKALPTIIFDEIDTGVSGDVASKMGEMMKQIAGSTQVISITHLPQIASKGETHYFVYKQTDSEATYTQMKVLNQNERVEELAKMLSGSNITEAAMQNAKSLLQG
jgi:DNA repair protein RecN (Recombination protein N)